MRTYSTRTTAVFVLLAAVTGCAAERPTCTLIGARVGVALDIKAPYAGRTAEAAMEVCWDQVCRTPGIRLQPSTTSVPRTCAGSDPDDACAAEAVPTGGEHGFGDVSDLPKRPVRVRLILRDDKGAELLDERITVTPEAVYPNGRECGEGGPQAGVVVEGDGRVHERA